MSRRLEGMSVIESGDGITASDRLAERVGGLDDRWEQSWIKHTSIQSLTLKAP